MTTLLPLLPLLPLLLGIQATAARGQPQARPADEPVVSAPVVSTNGRFAALLEPTPEPGGGMARVLRRDPASGATVGDELWRARFPLRPEPWTAVLSEDGRALCLLERGFSQGHAVARLFRLGRELSGVPGTRFELDLRSLPSEGERRLWFLEGEEGPRSTWLVTEEGPEQFVRILPPVGGPRFLSLETAAVLLAPPAATDDPGVDHERPLTDVGPGSLPYLDGIDAPTHAVLGERLQVAVRGSYPTPGWSLRGYALDRSTPGELVLVPACRPPAPGLVVAQVLSPFRHLPVLTGLGPGEHVLRARGRDGETGPLHVRVHPRRFLAELSVTGGPAALSRRTVLYSDAAATLEPESGATASHHAVPLDLDEEARTALSLVSAADLEAPADAAASLATVELVWRTERGLRRAVVPEGRAKGTLLRAVEALDRVTELCAAERGRRRRD